MTGDTADLPKLGVGILYNPSLPEFVEAHGDSFDYLEVIPDMFWVTGEGEGKARYSELEAWVDVLEAVRATRPLVGHNIGLSLGSAEFASDAYIAQLTRWGKRFGFPWHSDHLSFARLPGTDGHDHDAGLALPVPYDLDVLGLIAERIRRVRSAAQRPFLVENNVYFIALPEQDLTEPQFLNALCAQAGCGLLLDLHNLYTNATNHDFDAFEFLGALDLTRVGEIHVAGGSELGGMHVDSHSGPCPEAVWALLEHVLPRAPNVGGVTFEFHDSYYPLMKAQGIRQELARARQIWQRHH
jgi:uncharacterized protein (UPF0276 family)